MRGVAIVGVLVVVGCAPTPAPVDWPPSDMTGWPSLTPQPMTLPEGLFAFCAPPPVARRLGPHFAPQVRYLVRPGGEAAVRDGPFPVPVGTLVVKAKSWATHGDPDEWYAGMLKREAGYDPGAGDWEYLTARREDGRWQVERGRLADCSGCHQQAAGTDYLFRSYLKP